MSFFKSLILFTLPMYYSLHTRYKGITGIFAWLTKYLIPCFFIALCCEDFSLLLFVLGLFYVYEFYEMGYIQNDCETIKKELHPTMRLSPAELIAYEKWKYLIVIIRIAETAILASCLYMLGVRWQLLVFYAFTYVIFVFYNTIRNGFCLVVHVVLMMMRYTAPVYLSANVESFWIAVLLFLTYPLTLYVERAVKGKFGYRSKLLTKFVLSSYEGRYVFRIKYYCALTFLLIAAVCFAGAPFMSLVPVLVLLASSVMTYKNEKLQYNK